LQAGTSRGTSRIRLPTPPERKKLSPLKEYVPKKITKRRKKKKWSQWEVDNLKTGIKVYVLVLTNQVTIIFCLVFH